MYRNIVLTILLLITGLIAIELARPPQKRPEDPAAVRFEAARRILSRRIPELKLHGLTVGQSLDEIRRQTGIPMAINWALLDPIRDQKVDVDLHDVALGDAVRFLLCLDRFDWAFYPYPHAEFDVADGTLIIATSTVSSTQPSFPQTVLTLRCYDVRDLLTDQYWGYQSTADSKGQPENRIGAVANMVQNFAGMTNYDWHGREPSGYGFITTLGGRLLVVQTAYGHMQVEAFLARLRAAGHLPECPLN